MVAAGVHQPLDAALHSGLEGVDERVEIPRVGQQVKQGESFGVVESVKAVSDVYAPVSGEVVEVNDALVSQPEIVNASPYERAWMIKLRVPNAGELESLMGATEYEQLVQSAGH